MRRISPFGWLTFKTSLLRGLIKLIIYFSKIEFEGELQISKFNLFHSTNADEKKTDEKVNPYFKLGNHQVLTASCLV